MSNSYNPSNLGASLQNLSIFQGNNSKIDKIQKRWMNIVPEFMHNMLPIKYIYHTKTLFVRTSIPVIYVQQYSDQVRDICNTSLGDTEIQHIRFVQKR